MNLHDQSTRLDKLLGYLASDPDNVLLLMEAGDLAMLLTDWERAKELVEKVLSLSPNDAVSQYRLAVIFIQTGQAQNSVPLTQALLDSGEMHSAVRFAHAQGLALIGRYEEAQFILESLLSEADSFKEFGPLYIRVLHHLGKVEDALTYANGYQASHPNDATTQGMMSLLYLDNNDIEQAAKLSQQALQINPNNLDAQVTAGSVALAYEEEEKAKDFFEKALATQPNNGRAWVGKGLISMLAADLNTAKADFEKAIEFMPTHLGSYNTLAWIQILQKDYQGAKATLEKSLEKDDTFGETHGGLAVIAAMQNRWEDAKRLSEIAVRLQSDSFSGQFARSLVLNHRGHSDKAQALVDSMFTNFQTPKGGNLKQALQRFVTKRNALK
jgi:tetratricopeptide (TPR) repeat protein